jgi:hypothetical protein
MSVNMEHMNVRDFMGTFIGKRVLDITQNDDDEFDPNDPETAYIELLFEDGGRARIFTIGSDVGPAFMVQHGDDCTCELCEQLGGDE